MGFQVWRETFDSLLLEHAGNQDRVEVRLGVGVKDIAIGRGGVTVNAAGLAPIRTRFFVDATGNSGIVSRRSLRVRDPNFRTLACRAVTTIRSASTARRSPTASVSGYQSPARC